jgi:3-oxoacyl-[acyl-carrier protein] reductase
MGAQDLHGRVAVVTGASRGIGRAVALRLAEAGADIAAVARSQEALASLAADVSGLGRRCAAIACDVTAEDAPERVRESVLDEFGRVDILINNAGGNSFMTSLEAMRPTGWRKTMLLNLDATAMLTQALLPGLTEHGNSAIVNVASVAGLRGAPLMAHYGAAKAALISLTQSLAIEVAHKGVRVNALVPGWIATDLTGFLRADGEAERGVLSRVPMARWGESAEIAEAALFLASDSSSFMTGQVLIVDGGLSAMP